MLEELPNELLYKILDNLKIYDKLKMLMISEKVRLKVENYKIKIVFVNNIVKKNFILKYDINYFFNIRFEIIKRLQYLYQNEFIQIDYYPDIYISYVKNLDIYAVGLMSYYISNILGDNYYLLPEIKKNNNDKLDYKDFLLMPEYRIYFEKEIDLENKLSNLLNPNKYYKTIIYNDLNVIKIDTYLIY